MPKKSWQKKIWLSVIHYYGMKWIHARESYSSIYVFWLMTFNDTLHINVCSVYMEHHHYHHILYGFLLPVQNTNTKRHSLVFCFNYATMKWKQNNQWLYQKMDIRQSSLLLEGLSLFVIIIINGFFFVNE